MSNNLSVDFKAALLMIEENKMLIKGLNELVEQLTIRIQPM
jgi:hypothetical protein